jgi:putative membrane protein
MAQHMLLIVAAAPLLVISDFPLAMLWALPGSWAQRIGRAWNRIGLLRRAWTILQKPVIAWVLFGASVWIWHAPLFYEAALRNETLHVLEHAQFLIAAMLFWRPLLSRTRPDYWRYGIAIPYLFTTALHTGILGALMTFTSQPWYPFYAASAAPWGIAPLQDQQLAGLLMWIPGGAVFTLLSILYFGVWFTSLEQRTVQLEGVSGANLGQKKSTDRPTHVSAPTTSDPV